VAKRLGSSRSAQGYTLTDPTGVLTPPHKHPGINVLEPATSTLSSNHDTGSRSLAALSAAKPVASSTATRRREQDTDPWRKRYVARAGVERTIAQAVQACDARRTHYKGLAKVRLEHLLLATAIDLIRLDAWWTGKPLDRTRTTHLQRLDLAALNRKHDHE